MADEQRWGRAVAIACAVAGASFGLAALQVSASVSQPTKVTAEQGVSCGANAGATTYCWAPDSLTFQGYGTVEWQSMSTAKHNVYAVPDTGSGSWGGPVAINHPYTHQFSPGTYHFYCTYHREMTGIIYVLANPTPSPSPSPSGSYSFTVASPSTSATTSSQSTTSSATASVSAATTDTETTTDESTSTTSSLTSSEPPPAVQAGNGHNGGGGGGSAGLVALVVVAGLAGLGGGATVLIRRLRVIRL